MLNQTTSPEQLVFATPEQKTEVEGFQPYNLHNESEAVSCICGTSRYGCYYTHFKQKCNFQDTDIYPHYLHSSKGTIQSMGERQDPAYGISLMSAIGNTMSDHIITQSHTNQSLFKKLDAIAKIIFTLPTTSERQEERKDDKQILGLLKLIAQKQGMSQKDIDDLRPPRVNDHDLEE